MDDDRSAQRIVVIGASAAGLRAAARARRLLPEAEIVVLDRGQEISTGACGLPYALSGDIDDEEALRRTPYEILRDPQFFVVFKGIEVRTGVEVRALDLEARRVRAVALDDGEELELPYDKLVIATGGEGVLPFKGVQPSQRIRHLRTLEDVRVLKAGLERGQIGRVVVIGGGFIGCEAAEAFAAMWGAEVELIEALPQVLAFVLDPEMARVVEAQLRAQEVTLHLGSPVSDLAESEAGVSVTLADGRTIEADAAVVALGVRPATGFAAEAGLAVARNGALIVDEQLRTSDPHVYAAGDCVQLTHHVSGRPLYLPLGSLANRHGRLIGDNLAGRERRVAPVVGSAVVKIFDVNAASTGLTEEAARNAGLAVRCAYGTFEDRADYYPEAVQVHLKLVYEEGGRILGLQAVGKGNVLREVDVVAALLQRGAGLDDLMDLEFAYAPPFATAISPLHHLAAVAHNAEDTGLAPLPPGAPLEGAGVIDVREPGEVEARPLADASPLALPLGELRQRIDMLPEGRLVLVCARGMRSYEAARILLQAGRSELTYLGGGVNLHQPS